MVLDPFVAAATALKGGGPAVAMTGSGISAESGIPTFRDEGGIWATYPPEEYATLQAYNADPRKVWAFWCELASSVGNCKPNPGHYALAELEALGLLEAVITQNVDNLHEEAGSKRVIEYHGNGRYLICPACGYRTLLDIERHPDGPPMCSCGTIVRPDVVMFGDMIPEAAVEQSLELTARCKVLIIVGTSGQVYPAAQLPVMAKKHGAFIIEANTHETPFTRTITDAFLEGPAGQTLPRLVECVKGL